MAGHSSCTAWAATRQPRSTSSTSAAEVLRQVENLQDAVSGVSLDEEAADMLRFQRAYEANARFFRPVDETLDTTLMRMVGA
jgi:flagellar hook-associated protein 1